eukprot:COSAG01_NODE_62150_length_286_cov_0.647059_1_plen_42_part_10
MLWLSRTRALDRKGQGQGQTDVEKVIKLFKSLKNYREKVSWN